MTSRTSLEVTTLCTPGSARAAATSIRLMRPCATLLRKIFPYSIPGKRRLCTYSARPVTLSHDSRRGTERPTWGVSVDCVARFIDSPAEIDLQEVALVVGRAVQIALDLQARDCSLAGDARRPVGGRADEHTRLVAEHHRYAHGGPVVGRARGALEVRGAALAEGGVLDLGDELIPQRGLQITRVQIFHRDGP